MAGFVFDLGGAQGLHQQHIVMVRHVLTRLTWQVSLQAQVMSALLTEGQEMVVLKRLNHHELGI